MLGFGHEKKYPGRYGRIPLLDPPTISSPPFHACGVGAQTVLRRETRRYGPRRPEPGGTKVMVPGVGNVKQSDGLDRELQPREDLRSLRAVLLIGHQAAAPDAFEGDESPLDGVSAGDRVVHLHG